MGREVAKVDAVTRDVYFFRAPKKGQLLFYELLEDGMLLLVIAGNIDWLTKKHGLGQRVVFGLAKNGVGHSWVFGFLVWF